MESRFSSNLEYMETPEIKTPRPSPTTSDFQVMWNIVPEISRILLAHKKSSDSFSSTSTKIINETDQYPKKEFKKFTWGQDIYEGTVVADNLHGSGFYHTQRNGNKFFYDGLFYMNKLEGYCQIFYENGTHFQGLFKEHLRYGPGVLSYPDGSQDVGFWNGLKLIRLACPVGGNDAVPAIANSQMGKTKLLSNRFMIPLCNESSPVQQALKDLGTDEEVIKIMDDVCNVEIRNPRSLFFHKKFYDEQFFGGYDCTIKVMVDKKKLSDSEQPIKIDSDSVAERRERLRSKIEEVNESLQTFTAIKVNLSERVNKCKQCCDDVVYEETSEPAARTSESVENISDKSFITSTSEILYDASLASMEIPDDKSLVNVDFEAPKEKDAILSMDLCTCDEDDVQGDLQSLEEQLQNITVQERYVRNICEELQKKLDRILEKESNKDENVNFKLVKVTELWAWNNEDSLVQIQKHCFKHRNSEDMINFSVPSLILGNRKEFGPIGSHEELCHKFLSACSKGKKIFVKDCLRSNKVHPNLADIRGNSSIFFASAKNQHEIIPILTNFGAKVDQLNDEQLTPLAMSFLQYISIKYNCKDWEKAFLPETKIHKIPDLPKWYDIKSFLSLTSMTSSSSDNSISQRAVSNLRIVDLFHRASILENMQTGVSFKSNVKYVFDMRCNTRSAPRADPEDPFSIEIKLKSTSVTIMTLLAYGANPNACDVPFPILVLSMFTENAELVREVLIAHADINILTKEQLSCLHIAASLNTSDENAKMSTILIDYGCNANHKTLPSYWSEKRSYYTGIVPEEFDIEDHGKNALHLLCMRTDYEGDESAYFSSVANALLASNLNVSDTYLGHTPLSLAVLSGNVKLIQCLLKSNAFDPYELLEYGMGNILTLYALKRFENVLSIDQCKEVLTALFDMNVNVLNRVSPAQNAIVFAEDEDNFFEQSVSDDTKKNGKEKGKPKPKKVEKLSKVASITEFMKSLGRQIIIRQIQMHVTEMLYIFLEEDVLGPSEIAAVLVYEYLTLEDAYENLQTLFQARKIDQDRLDVIKIKNLLDFVNLNKKVVKKVVSKIPKSEKDITDKDEESEAEIETMIERFKHTHNMDEEPIDFINLPGLDDPQKYEICFHCLRREDKELKCCPRCQMVHFCSAECNRLNLKLKTEHRCNIQFYDMTDEEIMEITNGVCLKELEETVKESCFERWQTIRKARLIHEEEKLLEMWRADTYGTKFLQLKPLLDQAMRKTMIGKQPNWSIGLLQKLLERNFQSFSGDFSYYSVENLLLKLQTKKKYEVIQTKQSPSTGKSTLGGSTLHSIIFEEYDIQEKTVPKCKCKEKVPHVKTKTKGELSTKKKTEANKTSKENLIPYYVAEEQARQFKATVGDLPVQEKSLPIKLKKIPDRYQKFIEIVGTYFPEIDLTTWLLPYTCYSGGQLYYKFCTNDLFKESYSLC